MCLRDRVRMGWVGVRDVFYTNPCLCRYCDDDNNNCGCAYDGGDCCKEGALITHCAEYVLDGGVLCGVRC